MKNGGNYLAGALVDSRARIENVAKREFSTIDEIERRSCGWSACSVVSILKELRQYFFGIRAGHLLLLKLRVKVEIKLRRFQASTPVLWSSFFCDVVRRRGGGAANSPPCSVTEEGSTRDVSFLYVQHCQTKVMPFTVCCQFNQ